MIYVLKAGEHVKFGFSATKDLAKKRKASQQTGNPILLEQVAIIEGTREDEKRIHQMCAYAATGGGTEWFEINHPIVDLVMQACALPGKFSSIDQRIRALSPFVAQNQQQANVVTDIEAQPTDSLEKVTGEAFENFLHNQMMVDGPIGDLSNYLEHPDNRDFPFHLSKDAQKAYLARDGWNDEEISVIDDAWSAFRETGGRVNWLSCSRELRDLVDHNVKFVLPEWNGKHDVHAKVTGGSIDFWPRSAEIRTGENVILYFDILTPKESATGRKSSVYLHDRDNHITLDEFREIPEYLPTLDEYIEQSIA